MYRNSAYSMRTDIQFDQSLNEQIIKIALIGIQNTGKSSVINCIQKQQFNEDIENTNGFQLRMQKIRINQYLINLLIWDGDGSKMIQFIQQNTFNNIDGLLYLFDLTNPQSIIILQKLNTQILKIYNQNFVIVLAGNKSDLLSNKSYQKLIAKSNQLAQKFINKNNNILYLKISAKCNSFVTDCFVLLIKEILSTKKCLRTSRFLEEQLGTPTQTNQKDLKAQCQCDCNIM